MALIHRPIRRCANSALFVVICARPVLQSLFPLPIGRPIARTTHTRALAVFGGLSLINSRYFLKAFFSASIEGNISRILNLAIRFLSLGSRDSSLSEEKNRQNVSGKKFSFVISGSIKAVRERRYLFLKSNSPSRPMRYLN